MFTLRSCAPPFCAVLGIGCSWGCCWSCGRQFARQVSMRSEGPSCFSCICQSLPSLFICCFPSQVRNLPHMNQEVACCDAGSYVETPSGSIGMQSDYTAASEDISPNGVMPRAVRYPTSFWNQVRWLVYRTVLDMVRNPADLTSRLLVNLLMGMMQGLIFMGNTVSRGGVPVDGWFPIRYLKSKAKRSICKAMSRIGFVSRKRYRTLRSVCCNASSRVGGGRLYLLRECDRLDEMVFGPAQAGLCQVE
jgi:hypothetical protein